MIVDFHAHIFPPSFRDRREDLIRRDKTFATLYSNPRAELATADELVSAMDSSEVDAGVVMGVGWTDLATGRAANDYILESVTRHPRRLIGFCSVSPGWGDVALEEAQRCVAAGARGVGELHPDTQGFDIADASVMSTLMTLAADHGLLVTIHSSEPVGHLYPGKGRTTPEKLYSFVRNFPQNQIVLAHWGGGLPFYALMPEVAQDLANVYFDSAATPYLYDSGVYRTAAQTAGPDKLLFGSDFPLLDYSRALQQVDQARLDDDVRERLLGTNAARLLGL